ncbi:hypothetical protein AALO_G00289510, partial [Alosa alosa]
MSLFKKNTFFFLLSTSPSFPCFLRSTSFWTLPFSLSLLFIPLCRPLHSPPHQGGAPWLGGKRGRKGGPPMKWGSPPALPRLAPVTSSPASRAKGTWHACEPLAETFPSQTQSHLLFSLR